MDINEKLGFFTASMTTLIESLCSCTAIGYLGNIAMICDKTTTDEIIVQGQIVGTPSISSDQIVEQLQNFILNQPQPLVYQGQTLIYVQRCSVAINTLGETSCDSTSEPSTTTEQEVATTVATQLPFAIIGGAAGGGMLLIIFMIVVVVVAMVIFRKIYRGKEWNMRTRETLEM